MPGRIVVKGGLPASVLVAAGGKGSARGVPRCKKSRTVLAHRKAVLLRGLKRKGR